MTIFFSADHHLNHYNLMRRDRPFVSVKEMEEVIIEKHNKIVKKKDTIYLGGDFAWNLSFDILEKVIQKLNGTKHFILGNHDKIKRIIALQEKGLIKTVNQVLTISVNNKYIWLSHYPHRTWPKSNYGSWHIHGHSHGKLVPLKNTIDCGVDTNDFFPYSFEQIEAIFKEREKQ